MSYTNDDGLTYRFGTDQAKAARVGAPNTNGVEQEVIVDVYYDALPSVATGSVMINDIPACALPSGALLRTATFIVTTAFDSTGNNATLTFGLAKNDGTAIDADGIDVAIDEADIDAVGDEIACDGALVGTVLANDAYVTVEVDTEAFTAGRGKLILKYIIPDA
jgi:hypothetical protein